MVLRLIVSPRTCTAQRDGGEGGGGKKGVKVEEKEFVKKQNFFLHLNFLMRCFLQNLGKVSCLCESWTTGAK